MFINIKLKIKNYQQSMKAWTSSVDILWHCLKYKLTQFYVHAYLNMAFWTTIRITIIRTQIPITLKLPCFKWFPFIFKIVEVVSVPFPLLNVCSPFHWNLGIRDDSMEFCSICSAVTPTALFRARYYLSSRLSALNWNQLIPMRTFSHSLILAICLYKPVC